MRSFVGLEVYMDMSVEEIAVKCRILSVETEEDTGRQYYLIEHPDKSHEAVFCDTVSNIRPMKKWSAKILPFKKSKLKLVK